MPTCRSIQCLATQPTSIETRIGKSLNRNFTKTTWMTLYKRIQREIMAATWKTQEHQLPDNLSIIRIDLYSAFHD